MSRLNPDEQPEDTEGTVTTENTEVEESTEDNADADEATDATDADAQAEGEASTETTEPTETTEVDTSEQDMEAFKQAAVSSLTSEGRDASTGQLPTAVLQGVLVHYAALKGAKAKNHARKWLTDSLEELMLAGTMEDFLHARTYLQISKAIEAGGARGEEKPKVVVDPTEAFVDLATAHLLAPNLLVRGKDVADDYAKRIAARQQELFEDTRTYQTWLFANIDKPEEEREPAPNVHPVVLQAARIAAGRASTARKAASTGGGAPRQRTVSATPGVRRDIAKHISQVFADKPAGHWMSVTEIAKAQSEEYGDDRPSQGAVAARLYPKNDPSKCNLTDVSPAENAEGKKGARKN